MDSEKLASQQALGDAAKSLRENPFLQQFMASARQAVIDTWATSDLHDIEGQRMCRLALRAQENFQQALETAIANGTFADEQLRQLADTKEAASG